MVVGRWQWVVGRWQVLGTHYQLPTTIYQLKPMQSQIVNRKIANAKASPSPCMAREGRACRDRQREGRACRDRQREGRAPARPETAWGKRTSRSSSLPTTYISTLLHGQGHSPRRRGAVATMPHDGEAHPSSDRLRGSLRSGDMSPRMGGRNKCDPPAFLPNWLCS